MKWTMAGLVLVAALLVPAGAAGDREAYTAGATQAGAAQARGGCCEVEDVRFVVGFRNGKPRQIKRFRFHGLQTPCAQGILDVRGKKRRIRINRRNRFGGLVRYDEGGRVRIRGKVRRRGRVVVGTLRARGSFRNPSNGELWTLCDSGAVSWRAQGPIWAEVGG